MNAEVSKIFDLLVENHKTIKKTFKCGDDLLSIAGSTIFTDSSVTAEPERLKQCEQILKNNSAFLSEFRGRIKIPLVSKMAISDNPERYLLETVSIYNMLNSNNFIGSTYKLLAAMIIRDGAEMANASQLVAKTNAILCKMRENHKWLTSEDDIPFAAILAVSGADVNTLLVDAERCYPLMKQKFGLGNAEAVQSLCHVLALNKDAADAKCKKVVNIYDTLKAKRHKFGVGNELSYLGILSMIDDDTEKLCDSIAEVDDCLKKQKGFGDLCIGSEVRRMYAAMVVAKSYRQDKMTSASDGALAMTVAVEISIVLMIFALMIIFSAR